MKRREFGRENIGSRVEDIFRAGLQVLIPDLNKAVRLMRRRRVLRIGGQNKLRELEKVNNGVKMDMGDRDD